MSEGGHIVVLTNVASDEEAARIARTLVERRLAACVNIIGPVRSFYRWQGEMHEASERTLLIKTVDRDFERLKDAIQEMHSYELPEVIAFDISRGLDAYLNWITAHASGEAES
jgi:periplasmic divalent cation tolerance protein